MGGRYCRLRYSDGVLKRECFAWTLTKAGGLARLFFQSSVPTWAFVPILLAGGFFTVKYIELYKKRPKRRIHVVYSPLTCIWCAAQHGTKPLMQLRIEGIWTFEGPNDERLFITSVRLKNAKEALPQDATFMLPSNTPQRRSLISFMGPRIPELGHSFKVRLILVDQFSREYKLPPCTLTNPLPPEPVKPVENY